MFQQFYSCLFSVPRHYDLCAGILFFDCLYRLGPHLKRRSIFHIAHCLGCRLFDHTAPEEDLLFGQPHHDIVPGVSATQESALDGCSSYGKSLHASKSILRARSPLFGQQLVG